MKTLKQHNKGIAEISYTDISNPNYYQSELLHAMKQNNNEFIVCKFFGSTNESRHINVSNETALKILKLLANEK